MAKTCGSSLIKLILIIINVVLLILGIALAGIGLKLIGFTGFDSVKLSDVNLQSISYIILVIGILIIVIGGFGFFGACCNSPYMLNIYGFLLIVLIAGEGYLVYQSIKNHGNIVDDFGKGMENAIKEISNNKDTTKVLQELQSKLQCCGWNGINDYGGDKPLSSCCDSYKASDPTARCEIKDVKFNKGCKDNFEQLKTLFGGSTGLGIALILAQIILILAACCLARDI